MASEPLPEPVVKKVTNLTKDARLAVTVGLIPILGLIFILRLVQWYLLKRDYPVLVTGEVTGHPNLSKEFRSSLPRLWIAVLLWPSVFLFIFAYTSLT